MMFPAPFDQFYLSSLNLLQNSMTFDPHNRAAEGWTNLDSVYSAGPDNMFCSSFRDQPLPLSSTVSSVQDLEQPIEIHSVVAVTTDLDTGSVIVDVVASYTSLQKATLFCDSVQNYLSDNVSFSIKSSYLKT